MRTRAPLLVRLCTGLIVGGLVAGVTVAGSRVALDGRDPAIRAERAARPEAADTSGASALTRGHDPFDADRNARRADLATLVAALLLVAGWAWWITHRGRRTASRRLGRWRHAPAHHLDLRHSSAPDEHAAPAARPAERSPMTQATMARPHAPRRSLPSVSVVALFVVGALLCVAMAYALQDHELVPRVTVENRSTIPINVDVRGSSDGSRLILATVPADTAVSNLDVLDQGDEWIFGFSSGGIDGGSVRVSRAKLAADGWRLVVPDDVVGRLQNSSFVPAYR